MKKRENIPIDSSSYEEINVSVVGNVDAGKSTTIGILTDRENRLDDGNGFLRSLVSRHKHEIESGRTSDISYKYYIDDDSKRIVNLVDLAGHAKYLKTTITGLCSENPDISLVCISNNLPKISLEHITLCLHLNIPIIIVFTKIDMVPDEYRTNIVGMLNRLLIKYKNKKLFKINNSVDCKILNDKLIPYVEISNKTGQNIPLLKDIIRYFKKIPRQYDDLFIIDRTYIKSGIGIIVTGITGKKISIGDTMMLGPINNEFYEVRIKSIHNNYYFKIDELLPGSYGCLNIIGKKVIRSMIKPGMVICDTIPPIYKTIKLSVNILHHSTTIKVGYNAILNCHKQRQNIIIKDILNNDKILRSGNKAEIIVEFSNKVYISKNNLVILREGNSRAIGKIID